MLYKYKAKTLNGKVTEGSVDAENEEQLYKKLKESDLLLVSWTMGGTSKKSKQLKAPVLSEFCLQLGTLIESGVSMVRALSIISAEEKNTPFEKEIYETLVTSVRQGNTLSTAMELQGDVFPTLLIQMLRSAEASGGIDKTAKRMAIHYDKQHKNKSKIKSALTYPKILGFLIVGVVIILMAFIIPQFKSIFDMLEELPAPTKMLLGLSNFVVDKWWLALIILIIFVLFFKFIMGREIVKYYWDKMFLRLPKIGKLYKVIYTASFARTLSSLYGSGLPIVYALEISKETIGNKYIEAQFDKAINIVQNGGNLSTALASIDGFIGKLTASALVGEETGRLDDMLDSAANTLEHDSEMAMGEMIAVIEPVMTIVMGVVVGFIMLAILLPVFQMYDSVGSSLG